MKKKNIIIAAGLAALIAVGATTALTLNANGGLGKVFADIQKNEYGCAHDCTGEYYVSHISNILAANPELNGTANVRVICKVSNISGWMQDIDDNNVYTSVNDSNFTTAWCHKMLLQVSGVSYKAFNYKKGDTIAFYGTVNYNKKGENHYKYATVVMENITVYKVNGQEDLSLLPDVVYLQ